MLPITGAIFLYNVGVMLPRQIPTKSWQGRAGCQGDSETVQVEKIGSKLGKIRE